MVQDLDDNLYSNTYTLQSQVVILGFFNTFFNSYVFNYLLVNINCQNQKIQSNERFINSKINDCLKYLEISVEN